MSTSRLSISVHSVCLSLLLCCATACDDDKKPASGSTPDAGEMPEDDGDGDDDEEPEPVELDSDNDGIPDAVEFGPDEKDPLDTDGDGKPDYKDDDSDNDGIPDEVEVGADAAKPADTDDDGTPDYLDLDTDGDEVPDAEEGVEDEDGDGTPNYVDGDIVRELSIVLDGPDRITSSTTAVPLSGKVLSLDGYSLPSQVQWKGNAALEGTFEIADDGTFSGNVTLPAGDNTVVVSAKRSDASDEVDVTVNVGYAFGGPLTFSVDVAYVGEARQIGATILLNDPLTNAADVSLVAVDGTTEVLVATLTDDGNLTTGDEIDGDGLFSGLFTVTPAAAGRLTYRVVVGRTDAKPDARSEKRDLLVTPHLTDAEIDAILNKVALYEQMLTSATDVPAAVDAVLAALADDPDVLDYGESDSGLGVWVIFKGGIATTIAAPSPGTKGTAARDAQAPAFQEITLSSRAKTGDQAATPLAKVGSSKALLIAAQYFDWGESDDVPVINKVLTEKGCLDVTYKKYTESGAGSVEDFKNLGDYGIVAISSHGDSFYKGAASSWKDTFGWSGGGGQVVLHSNMRVTAANMKVYEDDLKKGRLVLWGSNFGILPSFIERYSGKLPNSIIYMSICRGTWNASMANAFLANGASSYLGFSDYVAVSFAQSSAPPVFEKLLPADATLADAFTPGLVETDKDPAKFQLLGSKETSLGSGLQDPSFESGVITRGWSVAGDARAIAQLGEAQPTDGKWMSVISTGLGYTEDSGTLSQTFCVCQNATGLAWDWNFFSEEFLEYVGSQYQDAFTVSVVDGMSAETLLFSETIDSLSGQVEAVTNSFDQGGVYATGWQSSSAEIPAALRGKKALLKFFATDVGDSVYDTAVLVDNIKVMGCGE